MKYGIFSCSSQWINIGDFMQWDGILEVYKRMGIEEENIVTVERNLLNEYDGEYILLPITGYFDNAYNMHFFPLSPKIIPVFIGIHAVSEDVIERLLPYRDFGPFGCRDLETMKAMRKAGFDAYVSGCLSICRKKVELKNYESRKKVYLVDVPEEAYDFMPKDIIDNMIELSSSYQDFSYNAYCENNTKKARAFMQSMIEEITENAKMVITSRLHISLPLMAMGIPVITLHKNVDGLLQCRFSGLDQILNCYTRTQYADIDWNPKPVDIENIKEKTIQATIRMIKRTYDKYSDLCELSDFYEQSYSNMYDIGREASYINELQKKEFIMKQKNWNYINETNWLEFVTNKKINQSHLIIYGAGDKAKWMLKRYDSYIRQALSFHLVDGDTSKQGKTMKEVVEYFVHRGESTFRSNTKIENPEIIKDYAKDNLLIIVAAEKYWEGAGLSIARVLMNQYGLIEGKDFFMLDKLNNSMVMGITEVARPDSWFEVL